MSTAVRLRVNGVSLAVTDHGGRSDRRPPLVLAHATGFCGALWQPFVEAFRVDHRVIVLDQRGHGDSDKPAPPYEWRDFVLDLAGVIDALELCDVAAIGHSKGGAAVAGVAADFPGRIRRAVLLDPVLVPRLQGEPGKNRLAEGARRRRMVWSSRAEMLASFGARPPFASWDRGVLEAYVEHGTFERADGQIELKCPAEVEASVYEGGARAASLDYLPRIAVPTLLVRGAESATLPAELAEHAVGLLRDGRLRALAGVGHFVPMEAPAASIELARAFLRDTEDR